MAGCCGRPHTAQATRSSCELPRSSFEVTSTLSTDLLRFAQNVEADRSRCNKQNNLAPRDLRHDHLPSIFDAGVRGPTHVVRSTRFCIPLHTRIADTKEHLISKLNLHSSLLARGVHREVRLANELDALLREALLWQAAIHVLQRRCEVRWHLAVNGRDGHEVSHRRDLGSMLQRGLCSRRNPGSALCSLQGIEVMYDRQLRGKMSSPAPLARSRAIQDNEL